MSLVQGDTGCSVSPHRAGPSSCCCRLTRREMQPFVRLASPGTGPLSSEGPSGIGLFMMKSSEILNGSNGICQDLSPARASILSLS